MRESHADLKITEAEWSAFAGDFKATLDKFKVPEKEQNELFQIVGSLKDEIVTGESLYTRLGGLVAIASVVDNFLQRIFVNPVLNANPHIKQANSKVSFPAFKYLVTELIASATGGPQNYSGKSMVASHKHLHITEKEWDAFAGDFQATLNFFKVPEKEQKELFAIVGSLKADIVESPKKTLYDRIGGKVAVALVVDDLIDKVRTDYVLNQNTVVRDMNLKGLPASFKYLVTEIVCQATGGPQVYTGKPLKDSHKDMKITDREWQQFVALFKATLDKFKVPLQEQQELVALMGSLKPDIVS
jgi:hemoglobin